MKTITEADLINGRYEGDLYLSGYPHALPAGFSSVSGWLNLRGYPHALPAGLTSVGGYLDLKGYKHALPAGLASVGGDLYLYDYPHALPAGLAHRDTRKISQEDLAVAVLRCVWTEVGKEAARVRVRELAAGAERRNIGDDVALAVLRARL